MIWDQSADDASEDAGRAHRRDVSVDETVRTDGGTLQQSAPSSSANVPFDYHAVLNHIDTPIFVINADGEITNWNRSLATLTGESLRKDRAGPTARTGHASFSAAADG